jgi:hypothetical protein
VFALLLVLALLLEPVLGFVGFVVELELEVEVGAALESGWRAGGVPRMFGSVMAVKWMEGCYLKNWLLFETVGPLSASG